MSRLLLDTHAWFWLVTGHERVTSKIERAVESSMLEGEVYLSQISLWEIAHKVAAGKIQLTQTIDAWLNENTEGLLLTDLSVQVVVAATTLPGVFHKDPADRFIVATARTMGLTLITGNDLILAYADAGHVKVLPV